MDANMMGQTSATEYWLFNNAKAMGIDLIFLPCFSFFPILAQLSEKLVKKDQRKVEDTAAANRPSEVEKDFAAFFDNERMDAIEKMQTVHGSEEDNDIGISYRPSTSLHDIWGEKNEKNIHFVLFFLTAGKLRYF